MKRVAIVGIGYSGFSPTTPGVSYRELVFEAAVKAYQEAGIEPKDIGGFVTATEDFWEGYSIADEYCNDQLGAVLKPVQTVPGDFLHAMGTGVMMIRAGLFDTVAIESHSKLSNVKTQADVKSFALDPVLLRPLGLSTDFINGLEMNHYLSVSGATREQCARVVVDSRKAALDNPLASYGALLEIEDILNAEPVSWPVGKLDIAQPTDGCVVTVLASEDCVNYLSSDPLWIDGLAWFSDSPNLESRNLAESVATRLAAEKAYKAAGITSPADQIDVFEINDEISFKTLQHIEALKLCPLGSAGHLFESGDFGPRGSVAINPSGGALGVGHMIEASGGHKTLEIVNQLRGVAGKHQVQDASCGLMQIWRGAPSTSCAVMILRAN
ncbi:MAG: acetyl-CoA acetyltransferase [Desulfomonilia bacterium]|nr:acetyl-CoA acetyltransferase [Desulfomonilia bacterium]